MKYLSLLTVLIMLMSCTPEPQAIEYGSDMCDFCKMSIVDQQYAAELVTNKGKVYKFDAIECMLNFKIEKPKTSFAYQLVNTYEKPGALQAAQTSVYLISKKLPSPMGAFLTAFKDKDAAEQMLELKGGKLFTWKGLEKEFRNTSSISHQN